MPPFSRVAEIVLKCTNSFHPRPRNPSSWPVSVQGKLCLELSYAVISRLHSAAPFRAFLQERQYQKERGMEVGELLYYFGSRYSSKEFLYGSVHFIFISWKTRSLK